MLGSCCPVGFSLFAPTIAADGPLIGAVRILPYMKKGKHYGTRRPIQTTAHRL
nr:MAG TPA: hypothetical protein [Caudoviricetes sp.]